MESTASVITTVAVVGVGSSELQALLIGLGVVIFLLASLCIVGWFRW